MLKILLDLNPVDLGLRLTDEQNDMIEKHRTFRKDEYITFEFNPNDKHQFFHIKRPYYRLNKFNQFFQPLLDMIETQCNEYYLVREVSKLGRIHIHGILSIKNSYAFSLEMGSWMHAMNDRIELDTIDDLALRVSYMKKDKHDDNWREYYYCPTDRPTIVNDIVHEGIILCYDSDDNTLDA